MSNLQLELLGLWSAAVANVKVIAFGCLHTIAGVGEGMLHALLVCIVSAQLAPCF